MLTDIRIVNLDSGFEDRAPTIVLCHPTLPLEVKVYRDSPLAATLLKYGYSEVKGADGG